MTSLGLVVPAYCPEVDRLRAYVRALAAEFEGARIRVELDAPEPGVLEGLVDVPATVNAVPYRRGKGAAITAGFEALETDLLAFSDSDGSTPPGSLGAVVGAVESGDCDLAVGSRRHPDATVADHQTFVRRHLGDAFAWLARRSLDVDLYDYQCGAKAITADGWERVRGHLYESGFAWDVELLAVAGALDLRIREVPIEWEDRARSTVSPVRTSVRLGHTLVTARRRAGQLSSPTRTATGNRHEDRTALVDRE